VTFSGLVLINERRIHYIRIISIMGNALNSGEDCTLADALVEMLRLTLRHGRNSEAT